MRAITTGEVGSGTRAGGRPPHAGSPTRAIALAARPRSATPVFVDDGRRGRWLRRAGHVIGVGMAAWITLTGLALVGSDRADGLRVASDRAIALDPGPVGGPSADLDPVNGDTLRPPLLVSRELEAQDGAGPGAPSSSTPAPADEADDERSPSTLLDLIAPPRDEPGRGARAPAGR